MMVSVVGSPPFGRWLSAVATAGVALLTLAALVARSVEGCVRTQSVPTRWKPRFGASSEPPEGGITGRQAGRGARSAARKTGPTRWAC